MDKIGGTFAQSQEFRYDIRKNLTSINYGTLTNDNGVTQIDPNPLFGESITYEGTSPVNATPRYNGNISGITWRNKIEQTGLPGLTTGGQGYAFNYDNVNRLTQSSYYTQSGSTFTQSTTNALTEKINGYDEMGNIDTLQRRDKNGSLVNNLTYTYNYQSTGNQLLSVSDAGSQNITGTYAYDGNGNMTADSRKNITITYNNLDLPDTVKQGTSRLVFTYDASGNKLYKQLIVGGTVTSQRHYVEDEELTATTAISYDGKIESIAMDEGRIVNTGSNVYQYEYYLKDHLHTNRVTFRPNSDGTLNLTTVQNYYPFGSNMGDATMNYSASPQNLHLYEGKETQQELNLNDYDFGARNYDPVLGRWTSIDPLSVKFNDKSPYNYVENNPVNLVDPDGMGPGCCGTNTNKIPFGGSESGLGSAVSWLGYGVGAITPGVNAWGAFGFSKPSTENWTANLSHVQGNQISTNIRQSTSDLNQNQVINIDYQKGYNTPGGIWDKWGVGTVTYHGKAYFGTNFIGPGPNKNPYTLGLNPVDIIDRAAQAHDYAYWQAGTGGLSGALFNQAVKKADATLAWNALMVMQAYKNGEIDPITHLAVSIRTYNIAYYVFRAFLAISKMKNL